MLKSSLGHGRREEWAAGKQADGRWGEVRAYGVDDVETWLETAPITHFWISELLGFNPHGLVPAENWWASWAGMTQPKMSPALAVAGRDAATQQLQAALAGPPRVVTIGAPSLEEGLTFISASAVQAGLTDGGEQLARSAFIDDITTWRSLRDHPTKLVIAALNAEVTNEMAGNPGNHHALVILKSGFFADIELPPADASAVSSALTALGVETRRADEAGRLARRSFLAMRRMLAIKPELHRPAWSAVAPPQVTRGLLLAGAWDGGRASDQTVMGALCGAPYNAISDAARTMADQPDPLVDRVADMWSLVSAYDAWLLLAPHLYREDLEHLEQAVRSVLLEIDPRFELGQEQRPFAAMYGKVLQHSEPLRKGLARSMALLGVFGDRVEADQAISGTGWAKRIVAGLLRQANDDATGGVWASFSDLLPLLAEAAPDEFISAVRSGTSGETPLLAKMFTDKRPAGISSYSPHTGLLWALEALAWSPDHFADAVNMVAQLVEIDSGGRLANRPRRTLYEIFCPWSPQCSAAPDTRLRALDALRVRHPAIAWELLIACLPSSHNVITPTNEPQFRDWKQPGVVITWAEYGAFVEAVLDRALTDVGRQAGRWRELLDRLHLFPNAMRERILVELERVVAVPGQGDDRTSLWSEIRAVAAKHHQHPNAGWVLAPEEVERLFAAAARITPADAATSNAWLFDDYSPDLPDVRPGDDYAAYDDALLRRRAEAVRNVHEQGGWARVLALAQTVKLSGAVGVALADVDLGENEAALVELVSSPEPKKAELALSYMGRRFVLAGWEWMENLLARYPANPETCAILLNCTRDYPRAWEEAEGRGPDVEREFWLRLRTHGLGQGFPFALLASQRLLGVGRPASSLQVLYLYRAGARDERAETVAAALEVLGSAPIEAESYVLSEHEIGQLFEVLQAEPGFPWERLARLEWLYLPMLDFSRRATTLYRLLAEDPVFFVEVVRSLTSPPDDNSEPTAEERAIANNGYRLLQHWRLPPGLSGGILDVSVFKDWLELVRAGLDDEQLAMAEGITGQSLAGAPRREDGIWPCDEVGDILEDIQSEPLEDGLRMAIENERGFTTRAPDEGGIQEEALATSYQGNAERVRDRWPRLAAVFRAIAEDYQAMARVNEARAERFRRGAEP